MANSLRDEMKDRFRNYLLDCIPGNSDVIEEAVCNLVDIALDITVETFERDMEFVE
ncbi:MAG: hypothetical protein IMF11_18305 [Proteobacteria bacterium]|nr:hypothetical protein [Pseudomonadota bacterium]